MKGKLVMGLLAAGLVAVPQAVKAWSLEEIAEEVCGQVEGLECNFEDISGTYKFGPHDGANGGKFGPHDGANGGMGKIRSNSAYCLIRDDDGETADALVGDDWYQFGTKSRFNLTHAGKDEAGLYNASGQRLLDIVVFGHTLENAEIQNLSADFPKESGPVQYKCAKKVKFGKASLCTKYIPYVRTGYYMTLDTHAYSWSLDIAKILDEYLDISWPGFELTLGQNAPFLYAGTTQLSGAAANLTDGAIPQQAGNFNSWEWGVLPIEDNDSDPATSAIFVGVPAFNVSIARISITLGIDLQGHYSLRESGDPDDPGMFTATPGDPDADSLSDVNSPLGGATSTHLAASAGMEIGAKVCVDFGWFGTRCGNFILFDAETIEARNPVNVIAYAPNGTPTLAQWAGAGQTVNAQTINNQIAQCLNAPAINQDAEEPASPQEWQAFVNGVKETVSTHYFVCQKNDPPPPAVAYEAPSFKLCDINGNVLNPVGGLFQESE